MVGTIEANPVDDFMECQACDGTGRVKSASEGSKQLPSVCPACAGRGIVFYNTFVDRCKDSCKLFNDYRKEHGMQAAMEKGE